MTADIHIKLPEKASKILTIQSHVVHGYVGNKASTFPLQTLNWDVDVMNSVNFSNHTGYGSWTGACATAEELDDIYEGLKKVNIRHDAVLTGYVHGSDTLHSVGNICINLKRRAIKEARKVLWLLDPVMGDEGVMYVSEDVIPAYRNILGSKLVDIVTPNQFELELLLDTKITSLKSLKNAVNILHDKYKVKNVVVSSLYPGLYEDLEGNTDVIYCCVSSLLNLDKLFLFKIDNVEGYFTGVGDLFSALLIDRVYKEDNIIDATNEVLSVLRKVLEVTKVLGNVNGKMGNPESMKECELRVIECQNFFTEREKFYTPIAMDFLLQ